MARNREELCLACQQRTASGRSVELGGGLGMTLKPPEMRSGNASWPPARSSLHKLTLTVLSLPALVFAMATHARAMYARIDDDPALSEEPQPAEAET